MTTHDDQGNGSDGIRFTVKELLARMDVKLDDLHLKLDERFVSLDHRLTAVEIVTESRKMLVDEFRVLQAQVDFLNRKVWVGIGVVLAIQFFALLLFTGKF